MLSVSSTSRILEFQVGMVASVLMSKADLPAYRAVFQKLKEETNGFVWPAYMGDWDAAMRGAASREFPGVRLYGCLFHYGQALVKKAGELGLASDIRRPGEILRSFLAFGALPLLPPEEIEPVFEEITLEALAVSERVTAFLFQMN